jgi:alpha-galactosidase
MVVSKDKKEALVTFVQVLGRPNYPMPNIRLQGLKQEFNYRIEEKDQVVAGDILMNMSFPLIQEHGDFQARLYHLQAVEE